MADVFWLLVPLLGLGVFAVVVVLLVRHLQKYSLFGKALEELAGEQGLEYNKGSWMNKGSVTGTLGGMMVFLGTENRGSGNNRTTYTSVKAWFEQPQKSDSLTYWLTLRREHVFDKLAKKIGKGDMLTNNPEFDSEYYVSTSDADKTLSVLSYPVQQTILRLRPAMVELREHEIGILYPGYEPDKQKLFETLQLATSIAETVKRL